MIESLIWCLLNEHLFTGMLVKAWKKVEFIANTLPMISPENSIKFCCARGICGSSRRSRRPWTGLSRSSWGFSRWGRIRRWLENFKNSWNQRSKWEKHSSLHHRLHEMVCAQLHNNLIYNCHSRSFKVNARIIHKIATQIRMFNDLFHKTRQKSMKQDKQKY